MFRATVLSCCIVGLLPVVAAAAETGAPSGGLTAAQIVERNVAARGGLSGWRAVKTLSWSGKMEAGGNNRPTLAMPSADAKTALPAPRPQEQAELPFVLEMQRPRKSRLEIQFAGATAEQVYDGTQGWKVRPFLGRHQVESYTPEELKSAASQADLDGPLVDYAAKGTSVALAGRETVDGVDAYKLALTLKDKRVQNVWVDAKTFLEIKVEGEPRRLDGKYHPVWVYLRDYKKVDGLLMPTVYETSVQGVKTTEKINIEKIQVNPKLADAQFAKPQ
jgi:outer membrane lipoprotein-sorting protein